MSDEASKFYGLMADGNQKIYPSCKFTKLSMITCLLHIKCLNIVKDKTFDMLLEFSWELVPNGKEKLPMSFYVTKRLLVTWDFLMKNWSCWNGGFIDVRAVILTKYTTCKMSRWRFVETQWGNCKRKVKLALNRSFDSHWTQG